ncbi:MAG: hypothetical protein R3Y18_00160 [Bacillota bacterium]
MTLGELMNQATKLIEENTNSADSKYTTDSDVQNKMIPAINSALAEIFGKYASFNFKEITEETDLSLSLDVSSTDETALQLPFEYQAALVHEVASTITSGDDWNFTNFHHTKFQEILSMQKTSVKVVRATKWPRIQ